MIIRIFPDENILSIPEPLNSLILWEKKFSPTDFHPQLNRFYLHPHLKTLTILDAFKEAPITALDSIGANVTIYSLCPHYRIHKNPKPSTLYVKTFSNLYYVFKDTYPLTAHWFFYGSCDTCYPPK